MKRILGVLVVLLCLAGCSKSGNAIDRSLQLRDRLLKSSGVEFDATVTADYGDELYTFRVHCKTDKTGALTFAVTSPETISGITGLIDEEGGRLTFDDQALFFPMLADGQVTPVSAPWLIVTSLRGGYIRSSSAGKEDMHIIIDDSYAENSLQVDIYTDCEDTPIRGEILWKDRRILSLDIENYVYL